MFFLYIKSPLWFIAILKVDIFDIFKKSHLSYQLKNQFKSHFLIMVHSKDVYHYRKPHLKVHFLQFPKP